MRARSHPSLCQPGGARGCSVCCGLFNFSDISRKNLSRFLSAGKERIKGDRYDPSNAPLCGKSVRDTGTYICPFQGFMESGGKPGCLLHPVRLGNDRRDRSLFGSGLCAQYLCPAHFILDDAAAAALQHYVNNWYTYCVAITDPDSFQWIVNTVQKRIQRSRISMGPRNAWARAINGVLEMHARFLCATGMPVFYYSVSEYNLNKKGFSVCALSDDNTMHRNELEVEIERLLR